MKNILVYLRLEHAAHRRRLLGIFRAVDPDADWAFRIVGSDEEFLRHLSSEPAPDGIIAYDTHSEEILRGLVGSSIPFVGIGINAGLRSRRTANAAYVQNDNEQIGREAADFLNARGRFNSYAYVGMPSGEDWSRARGAAFANRLRQLGLKTVTAPADADDASLRQFLAELPKPAAVFAAWDGRASDVLRLARSLRIRVPADLSILGVDNDELICEHTSPTLTSVNPDTEGAGFAAAEALRKLMAGGRRMRTTRRSALPKPILVKRPILGIFERGSTAYVAPATALLERAHALIDEDVRCALSPADVASRLHVSRRLLDLRLREREATTLADLLAAKRLETAKRLLATTDLPIKEAFRQSGYRSVAHATRAFKSATGQTPLAWRSTRDLTPVKSKSLRPSAGRRPHHSDTSRHTKTLTKKGV